MSLSEGLAHLRAIRGGHRAVLTKFERIRRTTRYS